MRNEPLERELVDPGALEWTDERFREAGIALPTIAQLADPEFVPAGIREALAGVGPDDAHPLNLFRVHSHNGANRVDLVDVPGHVVLPRELTGVDARIVLALARHGRPGRGVSP